MEHLSGGGRAADPGDRGGRTHDARVQRAARAAGGAIVTPHHGGPELADAHTPALELSAQGAVTFANARAAELLHASQEALCGREMGDLFPSERSAVRRALRRCLHEQVAV